jgi:hypothetical protein
MQGPLFALHWWQHQLRQLGLHCITLQSHVAGYVSTARVGLLHNANWCCCCCCRCCCCCCRAATKLLQLVALPAGSPAALQLLQTLAAKACDKDAAVAAAALELLVQLDAAVLCGSLTAEQFVAVAQAGLECCSSSNSNEEEQQQADKTAAAAARAAAGEDGDTVNASQMTVGGTQKPAASSSKKRPASSSAAGPINKHAAGANRVLLSSAGQQQLLQLLRDVLLCDAAEAQRSQQQLRSQGARQWLVSSAGRAVGVGGCRQLLLMLLQDDGLDGACSRLADSSSLIC